MTINDSVFRYNKAGSDGGGIYNETSSPVIRDCQFIGNLADDNGGGIYNDHSSPSVINCLVVGNRCSGNGGGVSNIGCFRTQYDRNCVFSENKAVNYGGGIYNDQSWPDAINCTFVDNSSIAGGGVYNVVSSPGITNCIFWGNGSDIDVSNSDSNPNVTYSCVQSGSPGVGNIEIDPMFKYSQNNIFELSSESPCIDSGLNDVESLEEVDIYGSSRIQNGTVDMGVVELADGVKNVAVTINLGPVEVVELGGIYRVWQDSWQEKGPWQESGSTIEVFPGEYQIEFSRMGNWINPGESTFTVPESETAISMNFSYTLSLGNYICFVDDDAQGSFDGTSWGNASRYIQRAVDQVYENGGGEVWVAAGTYPGFTMKSNVRIYGGFKGDEVDRDERDWVLNQTVIDGREYALGVRCQVDEILDGLIITNCFSSTSKGAGMRIFNSSPIIRNCIFKNNKSEYNGGGGVYCYDSSPVFEACSFVENKASEGGAGMLNEYSELQIDNCIFEKNDCSAIQNFKGFVTVVNCTFSGNEAVVNANATVASGGGMVSRWSAVWISKCTFTGGEAEYNGGIECSDSSLYISDSQFSGIFRFDRGVKCLRSQVYISNSSFSNYATSISNDDVSSVINNCTFVHNRCSLYNYGSSCRVSDSFFLNGGSGVKNISSPGCWYDSCLFRGLELALSNTSCSPEILNCVFVDNNSSYYYSGIYNENASPNIVNCTLTRNYSINEGGAIYNRDGSCPNVINSIIWENGSEIYNRDAESIPQVTFSCVQGGYDGEGNIDSAPLFLDGLNNSLVLRQDSPCIDVGCYTVESLTETDYHGNARVSNNQVDIGAFEFIFDTTLP